MKTKLLKRIRKDISYKFKNGKCYSYSHLLGVKEYNDTSDMLLEYFRFNWVYYDGLFDWDWCEIAHNFKAKIAKQKFRKL